MKKIIVLLVFSIICGCTSENDLMDTQSIQAPTNIAALFKISQDNSGLVTITPKGEGVIGYEIFYGDGSNESVSLNPGASTNHVYAEGVYQVKIVGITLDGKRTETTQELTVSFLAPSTPVISITASGLTINLSATASLETSFQVYFGEDPNQVPVDFMEGEIVSYTYAIPGTYIVRVVALSGGTATSEETETITVTNLEAAPAPTIPAGNVISMFSEAYTNVTVDTWRTSWSQATLDEVFINGNATKKYTDLGFVGIETTTNTINATTMGYFHIDIWSSDLTEFKVKLVDFGANGVFDGGDDVEHEITIASPAQESWVSLDIPLSDFTGLTTRAHIAQLILVAAPFGTSTVYVDNVFFYNQVATLTTPAPTPTLPAGNVLSMFSDAYTDVPVATWRTDWSNATLTDITVAGNATKKYSALDFVGIEATAPTINATAMTHFHTDVWSADFTSFKIKLVDFGANGAYGGGDDVEHEITIATPAQGEWVSLDIPLADFTGLTTRGHIAQLIYVGAPTGNNTVYVDNVYFHN